MNICHIVDVSVRLKHYCSKGLTSDYVKCGPPATNQVVQSLEKSDFPIVQDGPLFPLPQIKLSPNLFSLLEHHPTSHHCHVFSTNMDFVQVVWITYTDQTKIDTSSSRLVLYVAELFCSS